MLRNFESVTIDLCAAALYLGQLPMLMGPMFSEWHFYHSLSETIVLWDTW